MRRYLRGADAVFALILFCVFTISILVVLMAAANSYKNVRNSVNTGYSEDICISYIVMKLRHYNGENCAVRLDQIEGEDALFLTETIDDEEYETVIYFRDGYVMEIFAGVDYDFSPQEGFEIVKAEGLSFSEIDDNLYRISCVGAGGESAQTIIRIGGW